MQGSQSQLDFLPYKHTDFIFTTIAEEFDFWRSWFTFDILNNNNFLHIFFI